MDDKVKTIFLKATKESSRGLLGGQKKSDEIDGEHLARQIEVACNGFVNNGYNISSILPVSSGDHNYKNGIGYGYGYSYTSGVIVVAAKI